ncbi:hypothetical protein ACWT_2612 [Actinoplanes sp. SE50]|uniref:hypothetical protein n=1 Tax=unclassified Actinoplanes TaxID=2626549 RepID=UPI00023ED037|nr:MULTISPECIES: hypothetical protein [unclassified Actinoplanes]AEV83829.1 hypothetical protein ACPL_2934 [Actinoplanes sp. SE50/110]ATO82027.1 hypothetical protein ACWT_2612 [Actinoplanes sp. SE50]SLL99435.1 hypothetical protein ACSP50_2666 [Actinoplanes sp. SE50/110]
MPVVKSKAARRIAACAAVAFVSVAFTAACGGKDGGTGTSTGATGQNGGGNNAAFTAYAACLAKNGVTITLPSFGPGNGPRPSGGARPSGMPRPSGSFGAGGRGGFPGGGGFFQKPADVDEATWTRAQEACASVRPSFGGRGNGGGGGANAAYRDCLKKNGVTDVADPNPSDATTEKAIETCKVLRPSAAPSS